MQKCDKCPQEFCSSINYKRHIRVHHRLKKLDKMVQLCGHDGYNGGRHGQETDFQSEVRANEPGFEDDQAHKPSSAR
ncbi:hypothetical protein TB1_012793 [Malus domestica]